MRERIFPHEQIVEKLLDGLPPKKVASMFGAAYQTVIDIQDKYIETILKLKDNLPDPKQLRLRL